MWSWIRRKFCEACLAGVQDALDILESGTPEQPPLSLPDALRARLTALPAPAEEAETNGRKKARAS